MKETDKERVVSLRRAAQACREEAAEFEHQAALLERRIA